jgi:hypothetical protein
MSGIDTICPRCYGLGFETPRMRRYRAVAAVGDNLYELTGIVVAYFVGKCSLSLVYAFGIIVTVGVCAVGSNRRNPDWGIETCQQWLAARKGEECQP